MQKTRDYSISCMRLLAMLFIISCHIMQYYNCELAWWFNIGVQIFLCISGYLYGTRDIATKLFLVRGFAKILISYYIVFLIFGCIHLTYFESISFRELLSGVFTFVRMPGGEHLWFVFTILCCYVLTPVLYLYFKKNDTGLTFFIKSILITVGIHIFFSCISHLIIKMSFTPAWINCYVAGFIIARVLQRSNRERIFYTSLIIIFCILTNATKIYSNYIYELPIPSKVMFFQYAHVFLGISLFITFKKFFNKVRFHPVMLQLSDTYSYEVYLSHQFFILGPLSLMAITQYPIFNILLIFLIICTLSFVIKKASIYCNHLLIQFCSIMNIN